MSWGGGTQIFDVVVNNLFKHELEPVIIKDIVINLLDVLESQDWDNVGESSYFDDPLIKFVLKERYPD